MSEEMQPLRTEMAGRPSLPGLMNNYFKRLLKVAKTHSQVPASIELAELHRESCFLRKPDPSNEVVCQCCGQKPTGERYGLLEDNLADISAVYGQGVALYFWMLKALIIQFSFIALGVIFAWSMFRAPSMSSSSNLIFDEVLFLSVMDTSLDESETDLSAYVWRGTLIYCLIYRLILDLMHRYIKDAVSHGRANIRSASQYTFMIMNVPEDLRVSQEHAFVQEILKERYPYAQIVGFTFAYDLEKHMKMTTDYIWYKSELNRMRCRKELSGSEAPRYFRCCYSDDYKRELASKCTEIENKCSEVDRSKLGRTRYGFITLQSAEDCSVILKENKSFGSCFHQSKLKYNGQEIYVMRAPEPEDICWDRLSVTTLRKLVNRILNCFIIVVLLGGHFAFCTWIMTLSYKISSEFFASVALSASVSVLTVILGVVLPKMLHRNQHKASTDYNKDVAAFLSLLQWFGSAIIPYTACILTYKSGVESLREKLVYTILLSWLSVAFLSPLLHLIQFVSLAFMKKKVKEWHLRLQGEHNLYSQHEANKIMEPMKIKFHEKYADMLHLLLYTGTFVTMIPSGAVLTLLGFIFRVVIHKYLMTSRCRKPDYINEEIALTAFKIEYYMFLTAVLGSNLMIQCFVLGLNRKSSSDIDYGYFFFACAIPAISVVIIMIVRRVLKKFAKSAYWQLRFVSYLLLFLGIGLRTDRKAILSEVPYREAGITNEYKSFNPATNADAAWHQMGCNK